MSENEFLRHALATINYRAHVSFVDAPASFPQVRVSEEHWHALQTLRHINDVLNWALSIVKGAQSWDPVEPVDWSSEVKNFYAVLGELDASLSRSPLTQEEAHRMFQGPFADVLTHIGQLASLRRLSGVPVKPENYHAADIEVGEFGPPQS